MPEITYYSLEFVAFGTQYCRNCEERIGRGPTPSLFVNIANLGAFCRDSCARIFVAKEIDRVTGSIEAGRKYLSEYMGETSQESLNVAANVDIDEEYKATLEQVLKVI